MIGERAQDALFNLLCRDRLSPNVHSNLKGPYEVLLRITDKVSRIQKHRKREVMVKVAHTSRVIAVKNDLV